MSRSKQSKSQPSIPSATMVSGQGTDAEIEARCAERVDGWSEMTAKRKADMVRLMRVYDGMRAPPGLTVKSDGGDGSIICNPDTANVTLNALRLIETMGSNSQDYVNDRVSDLASFARPGTKGGLKPGTESLSAALAFVAGGKPADTLQSSLLVQMASTHDAAMRALGSLGLAEYIEHAKVWGNVSAKLLNAYTRQAEVLAKLQRGGEQVIKHVHIDNRGGQAVVTEQVITGGGVNAESRDQPFGPDALGPAMLGSDSFGVVMPMSSREGAEAVPVARMRAGKRSAKGQ